jgi:hypothetical protein
MKLLVFLIVVFVGGALSAPVPCALSKRNSVLSCAMAVDFDTLGTADLSEVLLVRLSGRLLDWDALRARSPNVQSVQCSVAFVECTGAPLLVDVRCNCVAPTSINGSIMEVTGESGQATPPLSIAVTTITSEMMDVTPRMRTVETTEPLAAILPTAPTALQHTAVVNISTFSSTITSIKSSDWSAVITPITTTPKLSHQDDENASRDMPCVFTNISVDEAVGWGFAAVANAYLCLHGLAHCIWLFYHRVLKVI